MTDIAKTVLDDYQVRKTKKQKTQFIEYATAFANERGYRCTVEKGMLGARNIIVGDPDTAKVIYTAHYDTCPVLPFPNFITPKKISLYLLYQFAIVVVAFGIVFAMAMGSGYLIDILMDALNTDNWILGLVLQEASILLPVGALLALMLAGPANKHTANDNTSGVVTLLTILDTLPEEDRKNVAFVFFDMEETGLFGSAGFATKHKKVTAGTLLINFDCVSDGKRMLLAVGKKAERHVPLLKQNFVGNEEFSVDIASKGVFYPSDQMNFKCGVGVASLKYSNRLKTEYMDRIHTKHDTVFQEENIQYLTSCALSLANQLSGEV